MRAGGANHGGRDQRALSKSEFLSRGFVSEILAGIGGGKLQILRFAQDDTPGPGSVSGGALPSPVVTVVGLEGGAGSGSPWNVVTFMVSEPMVMSSWGWRRWNMFQLSHELASRRWRASTR